MDNGEFLPGQPWSRIRAATGPQGQRSAWWAASVARGIRGARGRSGAPQRRLRPSVKVREACATRRRLPRPPAAARACAVSSRCSADACGIGLGRRRDQVAAIGTSELPLPKTGPQDRCVVIWLFSCVPLRSSWGEQSESPNLPSRRGFLRPTPFFGNPPAERVGASKGVGVEFGDAGAVSVGVGVGRALPASGVGRPAPGGGI